MRQRLGRWWRWVVATRARRSALTLAVLAAMAAPFATGSYKAELYSVRHIQLTAKERAEIIARRDENPDCKSLTQEDYARRSRLEQYILSDCWAGFEYLRDGYRAERYLSLSKYVALNGAVMLATLVVTFFALTAAMAAVRKWWRWWW